MLSNFHSTVCYLQNRPQTLEGNGTKMLIQMNYRGTTAGEFVPFGESAFGLRAVLLEDCVSAGPTQS
jgi:hypothetical protein